MKAYAGEAIIRELKNTSISSIDFTSSDDEIAQILVIHSYDDFFLSDNHPFIIINADIDFKNEEFDNKERYVISYGLNSKATVTASSIGDKQIVICIQRAIKDINNNEIEPQEIPIILKNGLKDTSKIIACVTLALVGGMSASQIQNIKF